MAALQAALELMNESATTPDEKEQVLDARRRSTSYHGLPTPNLLAAGVESLHMNGRKRRIKKRMIRAAR